MKRIWIGLLFLCISKSQFAAGEYPVNPYAGLFKKAYTLYPALPKGLLEAVAFTNTRFNHLTHPANEPENCTGIPKAYGLMGLTLDGKGYFNNNLDHISTLSGYSKEEIIHSPEKHLLAWAKAYTAYEGTELTLILEKLTELPVTTDGQRFAFRTQLYSVFSFMCDPACQKLYGFSDPGYDLKKFFGNEYKKLSSPKVVVQVQSSDYGPALWAAASTCNFSNGRNNSISAVTIHDVEGTYAGCISWFQNCAAKVSAHYVVRSSDGQITQMVLEKDMAWHVGSENPYTIGIEHEGYAAQTGWYTNAMYTQSAALVRDITTSGYGIDPLRCYYGPSCSGSCVLGACTRIKGHQHFPNQTHNDPGPNWDWYTYYELINNNPVTFNYTTSSGNFYDSGGPNNDYGDDERFLYLIQPSGANTVTLNFSAFGLELNWDYLYIYDGPTLSSPLIGVYTGTNGPGIVTSTGSSILVQFRSDCNTAALGWACSWVGNTTTSVESGERDANLVVFPNPAEEQVTIEYALSAAAQVSILLTDILGRQTTLQQAIEQTAGKQRLELNTLPYPKGVYTLELRSGSGTSIKRLVIQ